MHLIPYADPCSSVDASNLLCQMPAVLLSLGLSGSLLTVSEHVDQQSPDASCRSQRQAVTALLFCLHSWPGLLDVAYSMTYPTEQLPGLQC